MISLESSGTILSTQTFTSQRSQKEKKRRKRTETKYRKTKFNNTLKELYTTTKWDLSQGCKDNSTSVNQSVKYIALTKLKRIII